MARLSRLGYLAILDGFGFGNTDMCRLTIAFDAKTAFMTNNNYTRDRAERAIRAESADPVGLGVMYCASPTATWLSASRTTGRKITPKAGHEAYYNTLLGGKGYIDFPPNHYMVAMLRARLGDAMELIELQQKMIRESMTDAAVDEAREQQLDEIRRSRWKRSSSKMLRTSPRTALATRIR
ncbi:hypothetical protein PF004_g13130 [Phytophthora fragariae]|uniref:Uncharacterized protein n=1 Tax=Phytophthora fragariae TaxID=53985 RepID=A0A6G0NT97_9STRA|nr:hypothetical protein PF004_g13130 [Phytophthora fragariae]